MGFHSVKALSTAVGYSLAAMVTDLCCHLTVLGELGTHCIHAPLDL